MTVGLDDSRAEGTMAVQRETLVEFQCCFGHLCYYTVIKMACFWSPLIFE